MNNLNEKENARKEEIEEFLKEQQDYMEDEQDDFSASDLSDGREDDFY